MKRLFIGIGILVTFLIGLSSCVDSSKVTYSGPDYVMFADTMSLFPVQNSNDYFSVPVVSTVVCDHDRTFGVEVDDKNSNAIENKHYVIESNSVTIKAGERVANLKVRGLYDNIEKTDSLSVTLRLVSEEDTQWKIYDGTRTRIEMMKSCPFNLDVFTGYCKVTSTFFQAYMTTTDMRLIKTEKATEENTIIMHDFFCKGYDIKLKFDPSDPLEPFVSMEGQVVGSTAEIFNTIHGNGKLMIDQPSIYTSYYNVCQSFVFQYMRAYVEGVDTVGTYINILEWISDEEAALLLKEGY